VLTMSRNLAELKAQYRGRVSDTLTQASVNTIEQENLKDWSFDELPEVFSIEQQGLTIRTYPALVVEQGQINLKLLDNPEAAKNKTMDGLVRLYQCVHPESAKYLRKQLFKGMDLALKSAALPGKESLIPAMIDAAYFQALLDGRHTPRSKADFDMMLSGGKGEIVAVANELEVMVIAWLPLLSDIRKTLKKLGIGSIHAITDINQQMDTLFVDRFLFKVPIFWLRHYQRYLKAILLRMEKLPANPAKDKVQMLVLTKLEQRILAINLQWEDLPDTTRAVVWKYRFMLQEYRVSLFSQQLKTALPISEKRINTHWKELEKSLPH